MKRAKKKRNIDRTLNVFDVYVAPLFLLAVGLVFIVLTFTMSFPEPSSLSEVRGHLSTYDFHQTGRGKGDYTTIITLQEGPRFWTHAIDRENAEAVLRERGLEVRYYFDPHSVNVPMDGDAIKAYGLWIEGNEIQSVDEGLRADKIATYVYSPAIGIFGVVAALLIYRRNKTKYLRYE